MPEPACPTAIVENRNWIRRNESIQFLWFYVPGPEDGVELRHSIRSVLQNFDGIAGNGCAQRQAGAHADAVDGEQSRGGLGARIQQCSCGNLGRLNVGLVEGVDPQQAAGDRRGELAGLEGAEELGAGQVVLQPGLLGAVADHDQPGRQRLARKAHALATDKAKAIDQKLCSLNDDYAIERNSALKDISVALIKEETVRSFMESLGKLGGQHKFPRVLKGKQLEAFETFLQNNQTPC